MYLNLLYECLHMSIISLSFNSPFLCINLFFRQAKKIIQIVRTIAERDLIVDLLEF